MKPIKAIETKYKGYRFRSRLEGRWAVFFDALGIKWEYEHEGFDLGDGVWYLPDFWLPKFDGGTYCEVKPDGSNREFSTAILFAQKTDKKVWLCEGTPSEIAYIVSHPSELGTYWFYGIPNADQAYGQNRFYAYPSYVNRDLSIDRCYWDQLGQHYLSAVEKARSARFEHGEKPFCK